MFSHRNYTGKDAVSVTFRWNEQSTVMLKIPPALANDLYAQIVGKGTKKKPAAPAKKQKPPGHDDRPSTNRQETDARVPPSIFSPEFDPELLAQQGRQFTYDGTKVYVTRTREVVRGRVGNRVQPKLSALMLELSELDSLPPPTDEPEEEKADDGYDYDGDDLISLPSEAVDRSTYMIVSRKSVMKGNTQIVPESQFPGHSRVYSTTDPSQFLVLRGSKTFWSPKVLEGDRIVVVKSV